MAICTAKTATTIQISCEFLESGLLEGLVLTFTFFFLKRPVRVGAKKFYIALEVKARGFIFDPYFKNKRAVVIFFRQLQHQRLHRFRQRRNRKDRRETRLLQTDRSSI